MTEPTETEIPKSKIRNQPSSIENQPLPLPLTAMVESLLFVSSEPVPVMQIAEALNVPTAQVEQSLLEIRDGADNIVRGLRLQRKGDRVQLTTRPECAPYIEKFLGLDLTSRLSKPALETLAIIAYQQPATRAQIEQVRGVNCDAVLSTLLSKGLIEEVGRLETAGRPIQYATTFAFLQHFGLRGLEDMPQLQPMEAAALEAMSARDTGHLTTVDAQLVSPHEPAVSDQPAVTTEPPPAEQQVSLPLTVTHEAAMSLDEQSPMMSDVTALTEELLPVSDESIAANTSPPVDDQPVTP